MSEIFNLSTLCRCCHSDEGGKSFKRLNIAYSVDDSVEIYEFILQETLGIRILQPSMVSDSYLICDICIQKLQIVSEFRQQVLKCEEKFKVYCLNEQFVSGGLVDNNVKSTVVEIKSDPDSSDDDFPQDSGYFPDKTESSLLPIQIKKEKITVAVGLEHSVEENKIKNEENEVNLKTEVMETIDDNEGHSKIRLYSKKRSNSNIKSKSVIGINMGQKVFTEEYMNNVYSRVMQTIKTENGTTYKCKICEITSLNVEELYTHIRTEHPERFKCVLCEKVFKTPQVLRRHITLIHNKPTHNCHYCKSQFKTQKSKQAHEKTHESQNTNFKCHICQKILRRKGTLVKHIKTHEVANKIHVCDQCGWSFHQRINLESHIKTVHLKLRPHGCTVCSKTYSTKKHLKAHMESHKLNYKSNYKLEKKKIFLCDKCSKSFVSAKRLKTHKLSHDDKFPCKCCSLIFEGRSVYKDHVRNHLKSLDSKHRCEACSKVFITKNSLNRHIDIIHGDNKKFICHFCGIKFSQKALVIRHIGRHHSNSGDVPMVKSKCRICKRFFVDIEKHVKNHDDDRKTWACDICGKSFVSNALLNKHKNQKHFSEPCECEVCGKKYVKEKSLQNHRFRMHGIKNEVVEKSVEVKVPIA